MFHDAGAGGGYRALAGRTGLRARCGLIRRQTVRRLKAWRTACFEMLGRRRKAVSIDDIPSSFPALRELLTEPAPRRLDSPKRRSAGSAPIVAACLRDGTPPTPRQVDLVAQRIWREVGGPAVPAWLSLRPDSREYRRTIRAAHGALGDMPHAE